MKLFWVIWKIILDLHQFCKRFLCAPFGYLSPTFPSHVYVPGFGSLPSTPLSTNRLTEDSNVSGGALPHWFCLTMVEPPSFLFFVLSFYFRGCAS